MSALRTSKDADRSCRLPAKETTANRAACMECFLLYLDNLDDWVYALALVGEKLRRLLRQLALVAAAALAQVTLIFLAIRHPAIGAAMAALLAVAALYRSATAPVSPGVREA